MLFLEVPREIILDMTRLISLNVRIPANGPRRLTIDGHTKSNCGVCFGNEPIPKMVYLAFKILPHVDDSDRRLFIGCKMACGHSIKASYSLFTLNSQGHRDSLLTNFLKFNHI